jgi:molybdate transport system substrate-binding protein
MMKRFPAVVLILAAMCLPTVADVVVFAAASTTGVLKELAATFHETGGEAVRFNFASSGALARQIHAGAPADIFISANAQWMDWLEESTAPPPSHRFNLAGNSLVLVGRRDAELRFDGMVNGRIAVGDFKSVPAGIYAEQALQHMGWLDVWRPHLVMASNVRTALLYVQRGEVEAGIVYSTDARAAGLPIIGTFPPESHRPIVYPAAACSEKESALEFLEFLKSDKAKAILKKHGFSDPTDRSDQTD